MKVNESSLLCPQFIPNSYALLETSARKNQSGLFYDFNKRASVYTFNKNRHLLARKKTRNGDSDHHFQTRAPQLLSLKKNNRKVTVWCG